MFWSSHHKLTFSFINSVGGDTSIGPVKVTDAVLLRGSYIIVASVVSHQDANIHRISQLAVKVLDCLLESKDPCINISLISLKSFPYISIISINVTFPQNYVRRAKINFTKCKNEISLLDQLESSIISSFVTSIVKIDELMIQSRKHSVQTSNDDVICT